MIGLTDTPSHITRQLSKILGLLGSHHDGEILAAAKQAHRVVSGAGLTWEDIFRPMLPAPRRHWQDDINLIEALLKQSTLTAWERNFVSSLATWAQRRSLTEKQRAVLAEIYQRVFGNGA